MIIVQSIVQSCIVFVFLTLFFYSYVSNIEREEFEIQLDKIVDDIFDQYHYKFENMFPEDVNKKMLLKTMIYGIINQSKIMIDEKTKDKNKEIDDNNRQFVLKSVYTVLIYIFLCFFILLVMYLNGYQVDIKGNIKESLFVLVFIFIIEIVFLNLIAKHYMSGNANYVTKTFTQKIIEYIDKNNLINNK